MHDTIDSRAADLMASSGPDGPTLVGRLQAFERSILSETAKDLHKSNAIIQIKNSENHELKGQIGKLNKMISVANADRNPDIGKATMRGAANTISVPYDTLLAASGSQENSCLDSPMPKTKPATHNRSGSGPRTLKGVNGTWERLTCYVPVAVVAKYVATT